MLMTTVVWLLIKSLLSRAKCRGVICRSVYPTTLGVHFWALFLALFWGRMCT